MIQFPTPPNAYDKSWATQLLSQLQQALGNCVKSNQGSGRLILQSPDGKSWAVTVNNSGTLTATVMDGSER